MDSLQESINFSDYLRILRNRKGTIFVFFAVVVCLVGMISFRMEPAYRATVTVLIDMESPQVLTTTGSVSLGRSDYYAYKEYFQSQKEILKSDSIISQAFEEFNLGQAKDYVSEKEPIKKFMKKIEVESLRDTRLLLLHVDNKDPKLAAAIANRIAEIYVERNLSYITKNEVMNLLKNEYLKLQTRLSEYGKVYKHGHPKIIRLRQEIEQMAARIEEEKERAESFDIAKLSSPARDDDVPGFALAGLKANNVIIQDRAREPILPFKPKKRLNIALAMVIGLFGGTALAFFFEYLDDTVKGIEDLERGAVQWPFLGSVPRIVTRGRRKNVKRGLFVQLKPKDPISEAFRSIRTSVLFSSTEENPLKSIVLTSPGPKEGKTTVAANLAITMADSGKKVLLVDADMRKSRLHSIFRVSRETGLSNILSGQAPFSKAIKKTKIENLFVVSAGPHPPNPSELLASSRMNECINEAKEKFDFILFDTPPIAVVTDAAILSKIVDGTILVIENGKTHKRILPRINQVLKDGRARVIGTLLNRISPNTSSYHYYSYYYSKR